MRHWWDGLIGWTIKVCRSHSHQVNNIPALVQIMARRHPGDKPLSEPMMVNLLTHLRVTRPQWVKTVYISVPYDRLHFTSQAGNGRHFQHIWRTRYNDGIMGAIASQITSLTIVFSTVYLDTDQRKHQSSASLAFVRGIHRRPVNPPHKWPVTRKMFPFDDVIMF